MELHLIVKRVMAQVTPDTTVRMNVKQLVTVVVFIAANTAGISLLFDRRMAALEHNGERQGDRITVVEKSYETLSNEVSIQLDKQNQKLDRLTDAINSLAVNVAKMGVTK